MVWTEEMNRVLIYAGILSLAVPAIAEEAGESIRARSERVTMDESIAAEQARATAQTRSEYGLELRPRVTNEDVGVALRVYLPARWSESKLRQRLELVAESERLRVAMLEWAELMDVYRLFCEYRALNKQIALYEKEIEALGPYLEKASEGVVLNHLAVAERAKLYSVYLDLVNDHEGVKLDRLVTERELRLLLGVDANLDSMAESAVVLMPPKVEFDALLQMAMDNRTDYKQVDVMARSLDAAEAVATQEDGFRLKYVQPAYNYDYNNGESTVGLSASFVLPWGTKNPDIYSYQQQRKLLFSDMALRRLVMEHRLKVLLNSADAYYNRATERGERIKPLLTALAEDMATMDTGRLEDLRDLLLVRERILDVQLGTTRAVEQKELIAVELAAELGSISR